MHDLALLVAFWAAFCLALVSPGPNFALIAGTALQHGRRRALGTALGLAGGEAVWAAAAVFGVSALAARHPLVAEVLRIGGGAFLMLLGLSSLRAAMRPAAAAPPPAAASAGHGFWRGFGLMLLNPKAGVFWVSISGLFLGATEGGAILAVAMAGAMLLSVAWHGLLAYALSADAVARRLRRARRGLDAVFGAVMTAFGLKLVTASS